MSVASTALVIGLWSANVLVDTLGQVLLKAAATPHGNHGGMHYWRGMVRCAWLWLGLGCYVVEFVLWLAFVSVVPLSKGVLMGSINIVAIMLVGRYMFKERLTALRVIGMLLIALGVAIVGINA
jgi:drug/metabolite transporter (DMT)-like permease